MEYSTSRGASRRPPRRPRRPERQQIMLRRGLALGGALIALILIVLGVKGCVDARARGALSDYARDVRQIVTETKQTGKGFFKRLEDPGNLSVTEFTSQVDADRSAMDNYRDRIEALGAPGAMSRAQKSLELVYELRAAALEAIDAKVPSALAETGAAKATAAIAVQMRQLLAADIVYESVTRPEINGKLAAEGIDGSNVPKASLLPEGTKWLDPGQLTQALGAISGANGGATSSGVHGLGLIGVAVGGAELTAEASNTVVGEGTPEVEVEVQNQGESTENGITVVVIADGKETTEEISALEAGATETAVVPLTPAPRGETTLEVKVEPVPGEQFTTNNEATYTVVFE